MAEIDPELWILVHGGIMAADEWPVAAQLAVVLALSRLLWRGRAFVEAVEGIEEAAVAGDWRSAAAQVRELQFVPTDGDSPLRVALMVNHFQSLVGLHILREHGIQEGVEPARMKISWALMVLLDANPNMPIHDTVVDEMVRIGGFA